MLLMTTEDAGKNYDVLGLVIGNVVRSKNVGRDIMAGLKSIAGGELKGYTEMMAEARKIATDRMIEEATKLQADAVIGVRYVSSEIVQGASEITAYGTAVKFK